MGAALLFHAERGTGRHDEANIRFSKFCESSWNHILYRKSPSRESNRTHPEHKLDFYRNTSLSSLLLLLLSSSSSSSSSLQYYFLSSCSQNTIIEYLLTYSMVQSPSWEANWFAASQEIPAFYGTRRFITALTSVRHLSLSWASPIQSTYPHPTSWRFILILSTRLRLGLPSDLFPSSFPTKTLYTPLSSPIRATCPAHLILLET